MSEGGVFHLIFMDEDHDLIVQSFESRVDLDEFVRHFDDYFDAEDEDAAEDKFWRFGFTPKHIIVHGATVENHS